MSKWNWLRIAAAVGGVAAGAVATLVPATAPIAGPLGAYLLGVATKTPGHAVKQ